MFLYSHRVGAPISSSICICIKLEINDKSLQTKIIQSGHGMSAFVSKNLVFTFSSL